MKKILKQFSLVFMFAFSAVFADSKADLENYRLTVTMVDPEFHCFALSNNMICNIPKKNWETETLPEVGTEVYILADFLIRDPENEDGVVFGYAQDKAKKPFCAWITPESKQYGLSCVSSDPICTAPAGYIFSAQYRDVILLSDGSQWIKEDAGKTAFGPESRLIVSKQNDDGYSIIDLDAIEDSYTTSGRRLTQHRYERVKPYVPETAN